MRSWKARRSITLEPNLLTGRASEMGMYLYKLIKKDDTLLKQAGVIQAGIGYTLTYQGESKGSGRDFGILEISYIFSGDSPLETR